MKTTVSIIHTMFSKYRPAVAFSGGTDSCVLLDIIFNLGYRPPLIYVNTQMEDERSQKHAEERASFYGLDLHVAKAVLTPFEIWSRYGFPFLGKMPARMFMQKHRGSESLGFKLDCSTCCRKIKIEPGRNKAKELGCNAMLSGMRGNADDRMRGLRAIKDGAIKYLKQDKITNATPLIGWTDCMIRRYMKNHDIPNHPLKDEGHAITSCMYCAGDCKFEDGNLRHRRLYDFETFRKMVKDFDFGAILLAIKYNTHIDNVKHAIENLGGYDKMLETMPHVFELASTPIKSKRK